MLLGITFAEQLLSQLGATGEALRLGRSYVEICSLSNIPFAIALTLGALYRAFGRTMYSLLMWGVMTAFAAGGPLLAAFHPQSQLLSVNLIAWFWFIGAMLGVILGIILLVRITQAQQVQIVRREGLWDGAVIQRLLRISIPAMLTELLAIFSALSLYSVLGLLQEPVQAQAAWTVALKLEESLALMPLYALSHSVASLVARDLGAGNAHNARRVVQTGLTLGLLLMFIMGSAVYATGSIIPQCFNSDPLSLHYVSILMQCTPLLFALLVPCMVLSSALDGAGLTHSSLALSTFGTLALKLPMTAILAVSCSLGVVGAWYATILARLIMLISVVWIYERSLNWQLRFPLPPTPSLENTR